MGYRSEVAIAIYGPEDAMVPMIAAQRLDAQSALTMDKDLIERREYTRNGQRWVILSAYFGWVEWLEGFPDVQCWINLLSDIADGWEDTGLAYEFVRIGEETDDVETDGVGVVKFHLKVSRAIHFDLPKDTTSSEDQHDNSNASAA
jgi:hypothetical protein